MEWFAREGTSDFLLDLVLLVRTGVKIAVHKYFALPFRLQGQGLAPLLLTPFNTQYKAASIAQIELTTAKSIGAYVWAVSGFCAIDKQEVATILKIGRLRDTRTVLALHYAVYQAFYDADADGTPFPMRLPATLAGGKTLLKNNVWQGVLRLSDKEQTATFQS